ncbi:MAG TPA: hypothetical protein VGL69_20725 [Solirubrobacteraceae bacterium]
MLAAIALPISMLAPWYTLHVSARGIHGFAQQLTGWDELSTSAIVCVIVAAAVCALIVLRAVLRVSGLGAEARRAARTRVDGALIAAAGLLCVVMLLSTALAPPSIAAGAVAVSIHTGVRWGVLLTLAIAAVLTALGVQMIAAAGRSLRDRRTRAPADPLRPVQPAPGLSQSQNTRLSAPIMKIPSTISQRKRVM